MTTAAQPVGSASAVDERESISKAKLALIGTVASALIAATPLIINAFTDGTGSNGTLPPPTVTPTPILESPLGSIDQVSIDGSEIVVAGSARSDVDSVVVLIGPRQADGPRQYWAARANVYDEHWKALIRTDAELPSPFQTTAQYNQRAHAFAGLSLRTGTTTSPTPGPSDDIVDCAAVHGDACFTGPGWGQASVSEVGS